MRRSHLYNDVIKLYSSEKIATEHPLCSLSTKVSVLFTLEVRQETCCLGFGKKLTRSCLMVVLC